MEQPPALSPEEVNQQSHAEYAQLGRPQTVTVFGILHIVFGAFGVFSLIWAYASPFAMQKIYEMTGNTEEMKQQMAVQDKLFWLTMITTTLMAIVTALILMAGIRLVKNKRDGLQWSNRYAWSSIALKVLSVFIAVFYTLPITMEILPQGAGAPSMKTIIYSTAIGTLILYSVYPVLSLILLNRPKTKKWFALQEQ